MTTDTIVNLFRCTNQKFTYAKAAVLPRACTLVFWLHSSVLASIQIPFFYPLAEYCYYAFPTFARMLGCEENDHYEHRRLSTSGYRLLELSIFIVAFELRLSLQPARHLSSNSHSRHI
jgi:hypothetical protein